MSIIWVGGIVRGGISFALALHFHGDNSEVLQIIVLTLVISGTLLFGTILLIWVKIMDVKEPPTSFVEPHGTEAIIKDSLTRSWFIRKWVWLNEYYIKKFLIHRDVLREDQRMGSMLSGNAHF